MAEEDVRACQLAFDMTAAEFSEARRKAQQVRQQAMGRREQDVDTSMETRAHAQVGESSLEFDSSQITASSFELQDSYDIESSPVQPLPHDNWIQHAQSSFVGPGDNNNNNDLSDLDSYFASPSTSQILPTLSPVARPTPPPPLSPDAQFHRLIALNSLQRSNNPINPAPADTYNLNLSFRLPDPRPGPVMYKPRPNRTPAAHLSTITPTAPIRHRVGIARTTREPPPSPSRSNTGHPEPSLQSRRAGVARMPSTRFVRSQRNITPLLLAQRASQAVRRSFRGRGHGGEEGIELGEFRRGGGGGGFFVLGEEVDVEAQQQQREQRKMMNRWWARVVLV